MTVMERPTATKIAAEREKHGASRLFNRLFKTIRAWCLCGDATGLIIISAHYGLATVFTQRGMREHEGEEEVVIDVTVPTQALVSDSRVNIPGGRAKVILDDPDRPGRS